MNNMRTGALALAGLLLGLASTAAAQSAAPAAALELRGGINVPTFDIADAVKAGPSVGIGIGARVAPKIWVMGDVDLGFHGGAALAGGGQGPDVKVYHYIAKLGYELMSGPQSRWSVILNAGAGALTFDPDGADAKTYPAINVGAKIGYQLTPRLQFVLSPQGDIALSKKAELGTSNAWVWPFTAGVRIGL